MGGVETFFVLSSFFLTRRLLKNELINIGGEIRHRLERLYPTYMIFIMGASILCFILKHIVAIKDVLVHTFFLQNYNWMFSYSSDLYFCSAHTWTLVIEIWLFLLWLVAFRIIHNKKGRIIFNGLLLLFAILYRTVVLALTGDIYLICFFPIAHADAFAIGSLLAIKELDEKREESKRKEKVFMAMLFLVGFCLIIISIAVTAYKNGVAFGEGYDLYRSPSEYLNHFYTCNIYLYISLLSAGVIYYSGLIESKSRLLKWVAMCGNYTYNAYLVHWPIAVLMVRLLGNGLMTVIIVAVTGLVGGWMIEFSFLLFKRYVEKIKV